MNFRKRISRESLRAAEERVKGSASRLGRKISVEIDEAKPFVKRGISALGDAAEATGEKIVTGTKVAAPVVKKGAEASGRAVAAGAKTAAPYAKAGAEFVLEHSDDVAGAVLAASATAAAAVPPAAPAFLAGGAAAAGTIKVAEKIHEKVQKGRSKKKSSRNLPDETDG